jgi:hypothetical protein
LEADIGHLSALSLWNDDFIILSIRLFTPINKPSLPPHFMTQHQYTATDIGRQSHRPVTNESLFFTFFAKNLLPIIQYVRKFHLRIPRQNTVKRNDQKSAASNSARSDYEFNPISSYIV